MIGLVAAGLGKRDGIRTTLIGLSVASVALVVGFGSLEMLFRIPSVAARWGTPAELSAWDSRYDRVWKENVFGFRSRHETVARSSGVNRAVVLGDSFTWGDKIAETDDAWPARLEAILNRTGDEAWEVINMAQNGYTTANEAELLRRLGWQFDPDLVLVQFYINDALPSGGDFTHVLGSWLRPRVNLLPVRFRSGWVQQSAVFSLT